MWKLFRIRFTEDYKYVNRSVFMKILYILVDLFVMPFVYLFLRYTFNYHIEGRKNLKSVRGRTAITVSNHVQDLDALMVTQAFWPVTPRMIARKHNLEVVFVGTFNHIMGAIPLPEDMRNFRYFCQAVNECLATSKRKLHVYPEGEIEPRGANLREFGSGAFHFAISNNLPVVPMVFVFPTRHTIRLIIGKPIELSEVPGLSKLSKAKRVQALSNYTRDLMQDMINDYYRGRSYDPREDN
ncbi:MAG: 1-acyl-sn-glycerol-3-phosphate acyltransferase [Clostridia bacterium]|nr:1-acyl-sn-glycerol-3-phosphate acyltransferase [Clostridia bacterium]